MIMKIQRTTENRPSSAGVLPTKFPAGSRIPESSFSESPRSGLAGYSRPTLDPPGAAGITETGAAGTTTADDPGADSPMLDRRTGRALGRNDVRWTSNDVYGAFSIEDFPPGVGDLTYTHDDALGWINFLGGTGPANFWFTDGNVQPWAYYEEYDNWQDTYGMDAALAVYHSGHGGMDSNGVFYAPVGAGWGGLSPWVNSNQMALGNEQVNYLFWSTCFSCRVLDGHNPRRTWEKANKGFRMLFGYETVSVDAPNYGSAFGEEWRRGKSLSTAWLDASWYHISTHQAPSAVACGASAAEAQNRLFNERMFDWNHVSTAWWWWRWYYAASYARGIAAARKPNLQLPRQLLAARLIPTPINVESIRGLVDRLNLELRVSPGLTPLPSGSFLLRGGDAQLGISPDGTFDAQFARANLDNRTQISAQRAISLATDFIGQLELDPNVEVVFDQVRFGAEGGVTSRGSGTVEGPFITETTVQFKQVINGLAVVAPGAGEVHVSIDNDGKITGLHSSVRGVDRLHELRPASPGPSAPGAHIGPNGPIDPGDIEQKLAAAFSRKLAGFALRGSIPIAFTVVPHTTEVGYAIKGGQATLVAQRLVEMEFGHGLRKQYWNTVPISE
jgi:hypothetical protein